MIKWLKVSAQVPLYTVNVPDLFYGSSRAKSPEEALRNVCYTEGKTKGTLNWGGKVYSDPAGFGQLAKDIQEAYPDLNEITDILTDEKYAEPKPEPVKPELEKKPVQLELFTSWLVGPFTRNSYIVHMPGHTNSQGESAPYVIKSHDTNKILSSHKTREEAKSHLQQIHIFKK